MVACVDDNDHASALEHDCKPFDDATLDEVLLHNLIDVLFGFRLVPNALWINHQQWPGITKPKAATWNHRHVWQLTHLQSLTQAFPERRCTLSCTTTARMRGWALLTTRKGMITKDDRKFFCGTHDELPTSKKGARKRLCRVQRPAKNLRGIAFAFGLFGRN
jgi:hypothetical protein